MPGVSADSPARSGVHDHGDAVREIVLRSLAAASPLTRETCWSQAALFAVSVAEMLPVIVTTTLARGAANLAYRKVIVKRLDAIGDLGAMDVLCVDKTGTLTEDRVVFAHGVDATGRRDEDIAAYAWPRS